MNKKDLSERELLDSSNISYVQLKDVPEGMARQEVIFTKQAPGALPNGTRIRKINSLPPDANQDGALGTVEASLGPVPDGVFAGIYGYFVRWDSRKDVQVFITGTRVEAVTQ